MNKKQTLVSSAQYVDVAQSGVGQRLDNYLLRMWKSVPRSHVYRLIREGQVRVNGSRCRVHQKLVIGDIIRLPPIRTAVKSPIVIPRSFPTLKKRTLYEDPSLLIIDKPSGIAAHGGSGLHGGIIEALRQQNSPGTYLELVHRLDRETSGCLMLAKDPEVLRLLHKSIQDSTSSGIKKKYLSLLVGNWAYGPRNVDLSLATVRPPSQTKRSVVTEKGRYANSRFVPIRRFEKYVLMEIELKTGRMHQIRAHAAAIGYPVGGDRKYGSRDGNRRLRRFGLKRLFLHAVELELIHPKTGKKISVKAGLPNELTEVLEELS